MSKSSKLEQCEEYKILKQFCFSCHSAQRSAAAFSFVCAVPHLVIKTKNKKLCYSCLPGYQGADQDRH